MDKGFFKVMATEEIAEPADDSGASSSGVVLGQEGTLAASSVVKHYWVGRPDVAIRVRKVPWRKMYIPVVGWEDVPPNPI